MIHQIIFLKLRFTPRGYYAIRKQWKIDIAERKGTQLNLF